MFLVTAATFFVRAGFSTSADLNKHVAVLTGGELLAIVLTSASVLSRLGHAARAVVQSAIISVAGAMLTYAAATANWPLADSYLLAADQWIGYDWRQYAEFFRSHPGVAAKVLPWYWWFFGQPILAIAVLSITGRIAKLERYILAVMLSLAMTVSLFVLLPVTTA